MSIIAFCSNEEKETGQTMSMVALSTYLAIKHNYRILMVSTNYKDKTLENSYRNLDKQNSLMKDLVENGDINAIGMESGIEGLAQIIHVNRVSPNIVSNYTEAVLKNRLDLLCAPRSKNNIEYKSIAQLYPNIIQLANTSYDLVFVDISNRIPQEQVKQILEFADVIVVNITQRLKVINDFIKLRENNEFFKKNNILINIGRYDPFSKYNTKNITRYLKEKKQIEAIPYNTLFFEACSEAKVVDFFLRLAKISPDDANYIFMEETARFAKDLIYKLQEIQLKA